MWLVNFAVASANPATTRTAAAAATAAWARLRRRPSRCLYGAAGGMAPPPSPGSGDPRGREAGTGAVVSQTRPGATVPEAGRPEATGSLSGCGRDGSACGAVRQVPGVGGPDEDGASGPPCTSVEGATRVASPTSARAWGGVFGVAPLPGRVEDCGSAPTTDRVRRLVPVPPEGPAPVWAQATSGRPRAPAVVAGSARRPPARPTGGCSPGPSATRLPCRPVAVGSSTSRRTSTVA